MNWLISAFYIYVLNRYQYIFCSFLKQFTCIYVFKMVAKVLGNSEIMIILLLYLDGSCYASFNQRVHYELYMS